MVIDKDQVLPILKKAEKGLRITTQEAGRLFYCDDLLVLGKVANAIARQKNGKVVSYVVDRNINYTNICVGNCHFCAFSRKPDSSDAYLLTYEQIEQKTNELVNLGGTQVLLQGGLHPDLPLSWYTQLIALMKKKFPRVIFHAFSPPEILHLAKLSGLGPLGVIKALKEAGWESMPGGGAEILSEKVRLKMGKTKISTKEWLDIMEHCHQQGIGTTATMMFGHVETRENRVEHLDCIRSLQDRTGGFRAFIPWIFQPGNNLLGERVVHKASAVDYLQTLAISRIFLDNVRNIQGSWVTMGEKIGQLSLFFGANDLGSTMLEENVVAAAGCVNHMNEKDMIRLINDAGFVPTKRDTFYSYQKSDSVN
ncbi:MAG TPA: cyclic dehypoxanthinyl futalosine synthase [Thermodesulfobacteriota bacterium]|nr:cyclic dehypoxanthinyl futalosine synthase [Thermodesulfobacteriota bacterium]